MRRSGRSVISLRWQLTLYYGSFFALILFLFTLLSYTIDARGQYDSVDRVLVASAEQAASLATLNPTLPASDPEHDGLNILLRFYTTDGTLIDATPSGSSAPTIDARSVLRHPSGPAYDVVTAWFPSFLSPQLTPSDGAFGLLQPPGGDWRVYVHPIRHQGRVTAYVEALTPLASVDTTVQAFRVLFPLLGLISLFGALLGSWAIAARALRPISTLIETAHDISLSHDLSRRVPAPASPRLDELGRLATTFNAMLASIETAYQTQTRLVSDASHELRAPLTALRGNLELLRRHPTMSTDEREEALNEMDRESSRLMRLVSDLLVLARADAGIRLLRCPLDLDVLVLDAFRTAHQLAHGQRLVLEPFEPVRIEGDSDRLTQLLIILLDNAIKYTPADGQVTLGIQHHGNDVDILVRDTGVGIVPEDIPHIFDRFYRGESARCLDPSGTGLGLSIAQWIIKQHQGTVTVVSQLGQGTTIRVRFPSFSASEPSDSTLLLLSKHAS